jgi:hypothetical protein
MRRDYEVFEKFSDGSTLWRASVNGQFEAQRKMQEFREHSENEFFILHVVEPRHFIPASATSRPRLPTRAPASAA